MSDTTTPAATTQWYASKTLWTNVVALAASFGAKQIGVDIDAQTQVGILVVINLILRIVTKQPISWS